MSLPFGTITIDPPIGVSIDLSAKLSAGDGKVLTEEYRKVPAGATSFALPYVPNRVTRWTIETRNSKHIPRRVFNYAGGDYTLAALLEAGLAEYDTPDYALMQELIDAALEDFEGGTGGGNTIPAFDAQGNSVNIPLTLTGAIPAFDAEGNAVNIALG